MLDEVAAFEFEPRMSANDALMWAIEKDPLLRSTITMVMVLDRSPDREAFTRRMERVTRAVPRLRQRVVGHPFSIAPPRWDVDPNFDLHYHLRWMRATGDGTLREVFDTAQPIAMHGFDRARPLWEFTIVEGLQDGHAALIGKVHHSITDGVGGVKLQMEMLDLERHPVTADEPLPPAPEPHRVTEAQRWSDAIGWQARRSAGAVQSAVAGVVGGAGRLGQDPIGLVDDGLHVVGSVARTLQPAIEPLSPLMRDRSLSVRFDTVQVDLARMKAAARLVSGKLNDAFVAGVAGGLRRYHRHHGYDVPALRMTMPINIRTERTATLAGNQFAPARFPVPVDIEDPIGRMNAVREIVEETRKEPALALTDGLAQLLNRLPTTATTALFGAMLKGIDFITSNVPGPPVPVYLGGAQVLRQIAFGPMTGAATNITLLSFCDDLNIGINTDPAAVPDPEVFVDCLRDGFDEVIKLV
jgi:WS/DGAT/MGAT family acyltransferase